MIYNVEANYNIIIVLVCFIVTIVSIVRSNHNTQLLLNKRLMTKTPSTSCTLIELCERAVIVIDFEFMTISYTSKQ
jgi:hypothetical protein